MSMPALFDPIPGLPAPVRYVIILATHVVAGKSGQLASKKGGNPCRSSPPSLDLTLPESQLQRTARITGNATTPPDRFYSLTSLISGDAEVNVKKFDTNATPSPPVKFAVIITWPV